MRFITAFLLALAAPLASRAVTIDLVPVGNPGNLGEIVAGQGIFGRVTYAYQIGKTEVTNAQYVEFLNAKAATDGFQLYNSSMGFNLDGGIVRSGASGSYTYAVKDAAVGEGPGGTDYTYGDKPVSYVSWYSAVRFANWMHNGQGSGGTEAGAYTLIGGAPIPTNPDMIQRSVGATWFLPNEHEWYKAAYYNGATATYYDYPTSSDAVPDNNLPSADTGNSANFYDMGETTGGTGYPLTSVGAYTMSESYYDTRDQGGNVAEWNEALVSAGERGRRGGAFSTTASYLASATRDSFNAFNLNNMTGFRLATVAAPEIVPGDYNGNGIVDAGDYIIWRKHLGEPMFQLQNEVEGTSPGSVELDDYTAWRERFGNTSGAGSLFEAGVVPEPSVFTLIGLTSIVAFVSRGRRRGVR
jgi:formylglycine-generating enzyme required for sulfatase activity